MIGLPVLSKALPFVGKHWLTLGLVALLAWTQVQNRALLSTVNAQKQELAQVRGALQKLSDAAATLKPGETRTIYVDRPVLINVPGQVIEKQVPVVVTRTVNTIETKVQTVTLPPKEIERIIRESPQSLVFDLTATRDIKQGEKFRVIAAQIQPGVWQPILELGSPVAATVTTVTPVDRIPQVREPSRLTFTAYSGWSTVDQMIAGLRVHYALSPTWGVEAQGERRFGPALWEYRLLATVRW